MDLTILGTGFEQSCFEALSCRYRVILSLYRSFNPLTRIMTQEHQLQRCLKIFASNFVVNDILLVAYKSKNL